MPECGECTACCFAFPVLELTKPPWTKCEYANSEGCSAYASRPESCKSCFCSYIQMPVYVSPELRPDRCGVIFERSGDMMVGTVIGPVARLVAGQVEAFKREGFRVILRGENDSA